MREDFGLDDERGGAAALPRRSSLLSRWLSRLQDLIFPPVCLGCETALSNHDALCPGCWSQLDFIRPPLCDRLGIPMPYDTGGTMVSAAAAADPPSYDKARAVAHYSGVMRDLVHRFKFADGHDLRNLLSRLLLEAGGELLKDADVIVPMPLSRGRLMSRRFNQSGLLAQTLSRASGVPYSPASLVRTRSTRPQVGLTRAERAANVRGAFAVPETKASGITGRRVLLVDDVITTGASCQSAARALKKAGAAQVDVLVLALVTDFSAVEA